MFFFFPDIAEDVDWEKGYKFLDNELRQVMKDAELGRRYADKLAQVWLKNGEEAWVLVHVEVQGWEDADFPMRMFIYNYRSFDRFKKPVVSLAVLADDRAGWKPDHFGYKLSGCEVGIRFPIVKITDYLEQWDKLEKNDSPFAIVVMAHLKTRETRHAKEDRWRWKIYLIKKLYERGYKRKDIVNLFHFIDWLMDLPEELADGFWRELSEFEEEKKMPYISSVEKLGYRRGLMEAIEMGLSIKFGEKGTRFLPKIQALKDIDRLEMIKDSIKTKDNLSEIEAVLI